MNFSIALLRWDIQDAFCTQLLTPRGLPCKWSFECCFVWHTVGQLWKTDQTVDISETSPKGTFHNPRFLSRSLTPFAAWEFLFSGHCSRHLCKFRHKCSICGASHPFSSTQRGNRKGRKINAEQGTKREGTNPPSGKSSYPKQVFFFNSLHFPVIPITMAESVQVGKEKSRAFKWQALQITLSRWRSCLRPVLRASMLERFSKWKTPGIYLPCASRAMRHGRMSVATQTGISVYLFLWAVRFRSRKVLLRSEPGVGLPMFMMRRQDGSLSLIPKVCSAALLMSKLSRHCWSSHLIKLAFFKPSLHPSS